MPEKPPLPSDMFAPFRRTPFDTDTGSAFADALKIGTRAADGWMLSDEGPLKVEMPLASVVGGAVREALLHLLELGFIDIDPEGPARAWQRGARVVPDSLRWGPSYVIHEDHASRPRGEANCLSLGDA